MEPNLIEPGGTVQQPIPVLDYENPVGRWRVGTLVYSSAGLAILFCWLLWGDFAYQMKERSVGPVLQLMLKSFGASDTLMAIMIGMLPAAVTMLFGPVISYRSDRHRGRWGRRIPFLVAATPVTAFAMVFLAFSPQMGGGLSHATGGWLAQNHTILILIGLSWTTFEFATVAANAVFDGLINDVVPVALLGRFYALFRAISLIAGMIFNYWLLAKAEVHYSIVFVCIGLLYGIGFTIMCLKVKEGEYPPPPDQDENSRGIRAAAVYLRECFAEPYYILVFLAFNIGNLAPLPVNLFTVSYAKSINMSMGDYGKYIALTYGISLVMTYLIGMAADRFHPLRMGLLSALFYGVAALWGALFAGGTHTFAIALVAHGVLSGCYFTSTASLRQRLFPKSKFAQYASASGIISSIATLIISPAIGRVLDVTHHNYRLTFVLGSAMAFVSVLAYVVLYFQFKIYGGFQNYVAPE